MRIMITGAGGFMGRNLCEVLRECHPEDRLDLIDLATTREALEAAAAEADFVFHLAGVNRPRDPDDFMRGNGDFTLELTALLERGKRPPVVLASSIQAARDNPYGGQQARRRGRGGGLWGAGAKTRVVSLPAAQRVRQVVPPQLQQRGGHLLPQHRRAACPSRSTTRRRRLPLGLYRRCGGGVRARAGGTAAMPDAEGLLRHRTRNIASRWGIWRRMLGRFRRHAGKPPGVPRSGPDPPHGQAVRHLPELSAAGWISPAPRSDPCRRAGIVYGASSHLGGHGTRCSVNVSPSAHHQGGALASHQA